MADPVAPKPAASVPPSPPPAPPADAPKDAPKPDAPKPDPAKPGVQVAAGAGVQATTDAAPSPDADVFRPNWRIFLGGSAGPGRVGSGDGHPFAHGYYDSNEGLHYTGAEVYGGFSAKLWDPSKYLQMWAGAQGGYLGLHGDKDAPGQMNGGQLGGHFGIGMAGLYGDNSIARGPEAFLYVSAALMDGSCTAGGHFSVKDCGGFGAGFKAMVSPIMFQIGDGGIQPYYAFQSYTLPNARTDGETKSNLPWSAHTAGLNAVWSWDKPPPATKVVTAPPPPDTCEDLIAALEELRGKIYGTKETPGLKAQIEEYEKKKIPEKRELLKTRKDDPLDDKGVLQRLREDRADQLAQKDLEGLDPKKDADKIKEIKAKAAAQAEKDFPDVEKFWNPPLKEGTEEKIKIPENLKGIPCKDLKNIFTKVTEGKQNLEAKLTGLKYAHDAPFTKPKERIVKETNDVVRPSMQEFKFATSQPTEADVTLMKAQMAAATKDGKVNWDDPKLKTTMTRIFSAAYAPKVAKAVQDTAAALIKSKNDIKEVPIQGYTSKPGFDNGPLSDRRARLVMEMLVAEGFDRSLITAKGYGYGDADHPPKVPEEGLAGQELADARERNKRIEAPIVWKDGEGPKKEDEKKK